MIKVLNDYAGIGGNRKLWENVEVTAVELEPSIAEMYKQFFPQDRVIVGDAHQYLLDHYREFDFIWSSPCCQTHSRMRKNIACAVKPGHGRNANPVYPDMSCIESPETPNGALWLIGFKRDIPQPELGAIPQMMLCYSEIKKP